MLRSFRKRHCTEMGMGLGSDDVVAQLKGRIPVNNQDERKYMIEALACVKKCFINSGSGIMDFLKEIEIVKPDIFVVNEDETHPQRKSCAKNLEFNISC